MDTDDVDYFIGLMINRLTRGESIDTNDIIQLLRIFRALNKQVNQKPQNVDHSSISNPLENDYQWP